MAEKVQVKVSYPEAPSVRQIIANPEFWRKSEAERIEVLRTIDPAFRNLTSNQQLEALRQMPSYFKLNIGQAKGIRGPLTFKEAAVAALKQTARAAPEAIGFGVGGAIGGLAGGGPAFPPGMFAGGVTGAGLGSAGGEAINQLLQKLVPSVFETAESQAPATPMEAAQRITGAGSAGMVGEAIGQGTQAFLPALLKRAIKPETARELAVLEREGIPYTAGDVRPGGAAQITENLMRGTLLGGKVMQESDVRQASRLFVFKKKLLDSIGPLFTREEIGDEIQTALEQRAVNLFNQGGVFDKAYKRLDVLYPAKVDTAYIRREIQPIKDHLDSLLVEGRIGTAAPSPEAQSKYKVLIDRLAKYGTKEVPSPPSIVDNLWRGGQPSVPPSIVDVPITYKQAWEDKQMIDGVIRNLGDDVLRTKAKGDLKQIHNIFDAAMEKAAGQTNPAAAKTIRKVNAAYRQAKELMETESVVASAREMRASERLADMFFRAEAVTPARDLLRAIPAAKKKSLMPIFRRRIIENIFAPATHQMEDVEVTSGKMAASRFEKAKDQLGIYFNRDQLDSIKEFIAASTRAQKSGVMQNPASSRQMLAWSQVGSVAQNVGSVAQSVGVGLGLIQGQDYGEKFMYTGLALFGPKVLAQVLTNPSSARFIAKGFTVSPKTAFRSGWVARATILLNQYQEKADKLQQEEQQQ